MNRLAIVFVTCAFTAALFGAPDNPVSVWAVPGIHKVRPDDRLETSNLVWDGKTKTVTVAGAKNEHVPFQIVITVPPPPTRHDKAASGFWVQASDLSSPSGKIPADRVKLYLEHVVLCRRLGSHQGRHEEDGRSTGR